jgi:large subunit ribosomal protein L18
MREKKRNQKPTYKTHFRRRRESKTDYKSRLSLLKSGKPRLVVRRSLKYIRAQIVEYDPTGDKTALSATSSELRALGWKFACNNIPAAYLTGLLIGKKAKDKNIAEVVLDSGLYKSTKGSRVYAVVKGAHDAGLKMPHSDGMLPSDERVAGQHIESYDKKSSGISVEVERIKKKILD